MVIKMESILWVFPKAWRESFRQMIESKNQLQEVRVRVGSPVFLRYEGRERPLEIDKKTVIASSDILREIVSYISNYSLYAYEEEIRQGYLTIQGGHRIGFSGQAVVENGKIKSLSNYFFKYPNGTQYRRSGRQYYRTAVGQTYNEKYADYFSTQMR